MDGENIENDTKTIVCRTENILSVFEAKTPFSNLSGLVWTGPNTTQIVRTEVFPSYYYLHT